MKSKTETLPLLLFLIIRMPMYVCCESRKHVADVLLGSEDCCLRHPHHDFALKVKRVFYEDFVFMRSSGQCTVMLFSFMSCVQSNCFENTQLVEGMNSSVQTFAARAPNIKTPLVASRMSLMYGRSLTPSECTEVHEEIVSYMSTDASFHRFVLDDKVCGQVVCAANQRETLCEHLAPAHMKYACTFVKFAKTKLDMSVQFCYCIHFRSKIADMHGASGFLVAWSYSRSLWVVHGTFWKLDSVLRFHITLPLRCSTLLSAITDCLKIDGKFQESSSTTMSVVKYKVHWETLSRAKTLGKAVVQKFTKAKAKAKAKGTSKRQMQQANDPLLLCDNDGDEVFVDDSEEGGLIDLEYELGLVLEEEGDWDGEEWCGDDVNDVEVDVPENEHSEQEDEQAEVAVDPVRVAALDQAIVLCNKNAEAIADALVKAGDCVHLKNDTVSLIVRNASDGAGVYTQFIHWSDIGACMGRVVKLRSGRNRIVYNIPGLVKPQRIDIARVIIAQVPNIVMIRRKGYEADAMPLWAMLLKERLDTVPPGSIKFVNGSKESSI